MSDNSGVITKSFLEGKGRPPVWLEFRSSVLLIAAVILIAFFTVCIFLPCHVIPLSSRLTLTVGWLHLRDCAFKQCFHSFRHIDSPRSSRSYLSHYMNDQACQRANVSNCCDGQRGRMSLMFQQYNSGAQHYWPSTAEQCSYRLVSRAVWHHQLIIQVSDKRDSYRRVLRRSKHITSSTIPCRPRLDLCSDHPLCNFQGTRSLSTGSMLTRSICGHRVHGWIGIADRHCWP